MNIRKLKESDQYDFIRLLRHLTDVGDYTPDLWTDIFTKVSRDKNQHCFVVEINGRIVATATVVIQQKFIHQGGCVGWIEDVVIHPDHRGQGIFKMLMETLIETCKNQQCYKIMLVCKNELEPVYRSCGFNVPDGTVVMRLEL